MALPQRSYRYDPDRYEFADEDRRFGRHTVVKLFGVDLDFSFSRYEGGGRETDASINLSGMLRRGRDMTPLFESWRELLYQQTADVFANEGMPTHWLPLSQKYAAWKRKHYGEKPIMRMTDRLYASLTGGPEGVFAAHPQTLEYGTMVPYFEVHQEGWEGVPQRQMLVLLDSTLQTMQAGLMRWITTGEVY